LKKFLSNSYRTNHKTNHSYKTNHNRVLYKLYETYAYLITALLVKHLGYTSIIFWRFYKTNFYIILCLQIVKNMNSCFSFIVCSFQLGQADRFAYKLVNLAWCIYYCSIFCFELNFFSLIGNIQTVINTSWNISKVVWKSISLAKLKETYYNKKYYFEFQQKSKE